MVLKHYSLYHKFVEFCAPYIFSFHVCGFSQFSFETVTLCLFQLTDEFNYHVVLLSNN